MSSCTPFCGPWVVITTFASKDFTGLEIISIDPDYDPDSEEFDVTYEISDGLLSLK